MLYTQQQISTVHVRSMYEECVCTMTVVLWVKYFKSLAQEKRGGGGGVAPPSLERGHTPNM